MTHVSLVDKLRELEVATSLEGPPGLVKGGCKVNLRAYLVVLVEGIDCCLLLGLGVPFDLDVVDVGTRCSRG